MSERLPYEQHLHQQWTEVPLPDENMAWADMKRRLEEDDDDGIIVWWRRGCGLWALLLLLLLGLGWWIFRPEKWFMSKSESAKQENVVTVEKDSSDVEGRANVGVEREREAKKTPDHTQNVKEFDTAVVSTEVVKQQKAKIERSRQEKSVTTRKPRSTGRKAEIEKVDKEPAEKNISDTSNFVSVNNDTVTETKHADTPATETKKIDSTEKPVAKKTAPKIDSSKKSSFYFSTGLALQQQVPFAGQKASPYNALGRKGSLLDYIPSVYVRLNKRDKNNIEKWFIQAEFKYGAPQYAKEVLYQQKAVSDTGTNPRFVTNTSSRLKKTFYHQLPLTFNYYVKPNWSVGGGMVWNRFYGAVSDHEIIKHDNFSNDDSIVFKGIVGSKTDTTNSLAKSYFQAVFETQYKWKRFSIGTRFAFGLQPYIRFTLPGQPEKKEKNHNLQLFLRYELWRQKK
jgi:hypothetical protein